MVTDLVELVRSLEREDGLVPAEELLQAAAGLPDREAAWEACFAARAAAVISYAMVIPPWFHFIT